MFFTNRETYKYKYMYSAVCSLSSQNGFNSCSMKVYIVNFFLLIALTFILDHSLSFLIPNTVEALKEILKSFKGANRQNNLKELLRV